MKGNKGIHIVTFTLLIVGGLNWLVLALSGWDVSQLFGGMETTAAKVIYVLVGISAVYEILTHKANCRLCNPSGM